MSKADIYGMFLLIFGKAMFNNVTGHFFQSQAAEEGPSFINALFLTEFNDPLR